MKAGGGCNVPQSPTCTESPQTAGLHHSKHGVSGEPGPSRLLLIYATLHCTENLVAVSYEMPFLQPCNEISVMHISWIIRSPSELFVPFKSPMIFISEKPGFEWEQMKMYKLLIQFLVVDWCQNVVKLGLEGSKWFKMNTWLGNPHHSGHIGLHHDTIAILCLREARIEWYVIRSRLKSRCSIGNITDLNKC